MYNFEELDETTRKFMLEEFLIEENSGNAYRSKRFSSLGIKRFPIEMEKAIREGNENTLAHALSNPSYWLSSETSLRGGNIYLGFPKVVSIIRTSHDWYLKDSTVREGRVRKSPE